MKKTKTDRSENSTRYNGLCLPKSTNASILALKKLSRRIKLEIDRHPFPAKRDVLSKTWIHVNKVLQHTRQLESDHIAIEKESTNIGRKKYQHSLIPSMHEDYTDNTLTVSRDKFGNYSKRGLTISIGDTWKVLSHTLNPVLREDSKKLEYRVKAITKYYGNNTMDFGYTHDSANTYLIACEVLNTETRKKTFFSIPVCDFVTYFYLHDVSFYDEDFTPEYCHWCDTWQENWANDGMFKDHD